MSLQVYEADREGYVANITTIKMGVLKTPYPAGRIAGAVSNDRWSHYQNTIKTLQDAVNLLKGCVLSPHVSLNDIHCF